jgi:hypothetical protein
MQLAARIWKPASAIGWGSPRRPRVRPQTAESARKIATKMFDSIVK